MKLALPYHFHDLEWFKPFFSRKRERILQTANGERKVLL
jgi:hypothetical protein